MRAPRPLRTLLLSWLIFAIVLAGASSVLVVGSTRPEAVSGVEIIAHTISDHLAAVWDDPKVTEAYVSEVRDVTGFELRLYRHPRALPPRVSKAAERGVEIVPDGPERIFVPVLRDGKFLGALQMDRFGVRPQITAWWRVAAALGAALVVLGLVAGRVANVLAAPLERLAATAQRFGGGDLAHRADVANPQQRWVTREAHGVALAFNEMADRVETMVRGQRELLGAISHELRSPLGRGRVALEIARDRVGPDDPRAVLPQLDTLENQLHEIDAILGDLLAVTRAGLADLRKETVEIVPWLRRRLVEERDVGVVELEVEAGGEAAETVRAAVDTALLGRALHNLLANARAHGHPPDQPLVLELRVEAGRLRFTVRDRGPGFSADLLPRAFDPFVRGDVSRSRPRGSSSGGTGLGLALVRRIAEAHGGQAFARNVPGARPNDVSGAEVGMELPLAPS